MNTPVEIPDEPEQMEGENADVATETSGAIGSDAPPTDAEIHDESHGGGETTEDEPTDGDDSSFDQATPHG